MTQTIFLTGGSGFVGSALRRRLAEGPLRVTGLARKMAGGMTPPDYVIGDLLDPETYREKLAGADVAVHLAALTGKASKAQYWQANAEGTRALLEACRQAGVKRIVYISTIAAGYSDQQYYSYAQSKAAAEELVRASGLSFTILRPTLVLGENSPIWETLTKIAKLPVIPLPQAARPVQVQPVLVDDVARAIETVLVEGRDEGETLDVGGADPERFDFFLAAVRQAATGSKARIIRIPLAPVRLLLSVFERFAGPVLPVTAGQLALFANDSTARPNWLMDRLQARSPTLNRMLEEITGGSEGNPPPAPASPDDISTLERECEVLARYLTRSPPSADAMRHYLAALQAHGAASDAALSAFDRACVKLGRESVWKARAVDAYCGLFARQGAWRRKAIVFAAVAENQSPTNAIFEQPQSAGPAATLVRLAGSGMVFAGAFISGGLLIAFARLAGRGRP